MRARSGGYAYAAVTADLERVQRGGVPYVLVHRSTTRDWSLQRPSCARIAFRLHKGTLGRLGYDGSEGEGIAICWED